MSTNATGSAETENRRRKPTEIGYALSCGVFTVCVVVQTYIAGMAIFVDPTNWDLHTNFIHAFEWLPIVALVLPFIGRFTRYAAVPPAFLLVLIGLQYYTAREYGSLVGAIHPAIALVTFAVGSVATRYGWQLTQTDS